jgi:hypothetical protein
MKKLLIAASVAAGLAAGAMPAFAQPATPSQPGWPATPDNEAAGSVQAQNYTQSPNYTLSQPAISTGAHPGDGSRPDYLMHLHELQNMPGYNPYGAD